VPVLVKEKSLSFPVLSKPVITYIVVFVNRGNLAPVKAVGGGLRTSENGS
jgi:hypothetical protein